MIMRDTDNKNASNIVSMGFNTLMCFTNERFHNTRKRKVLMRMISV
jgi:hypothetical protein